MSEVETYRCERCNGPVQVTRTREPLRMITVLQVTCEACGVTAYVSLTEAALQAESFAMNTLLHKLPVAYAGKVLGDSRNIALDMLGKQLGYWQECEVPELRRFELAVLRAVNNFFTRLYCPMCYADGLYNSESHEPRMVYMSADRNNAKLETHCHCPMCRGRLDLTDKSMHNFTAEKLFVITEAVRSYVSKTAEEIKRAWNMVRDPFYAKTPMPDPADFAYAYDPKLWEGKVLENITRDLWIKERSLWQSQRRKP